VQKIFIKKCLSRKAFHNPLKDVPNSQKMSDRVRKWVRLQSKDFYTAGFYAFGKRWDKRINVGGGYVEK
jgi:hypothetical protein